MSNEIKATSFRLVEDDLLKFREIAEEHGLNQAEMFQCLLNNFEMSRAKGMITDRAKEIETFQSTVNTLVGMFVNSLAINQTSEERIRETLSLELNTKDKTIAELQDREKLLKVKLDDTHKELDKCTDQLHRLLVRSDKQDKDIEQKDGVIATQQEQINTLNSIVAEYRIYKEENEALKKKNKEFADQITENTHILSDLKSKMKDLDSMKEFYKSESEIAKSELKAATQENKELSKAHKDEIRGLTIAHKEEIERTKQSHNEEIERLKKELTERFEEETKHRVELETGRLQIRISQLELELERAAGRESKIQDEYNTLEKVYEALHSEINEDDK